MTSHPFLVPNHLVDRLPPVSRDGSRSIDFRIGGRWDGVFVVNDQAECVGTRVQGRVEEVPLSFDASEIEDVRATSLHHRLLVSFPLDLWNTATTCVLVVSPILLILAYYVHSLFLLASVVLCVESIYVMSQAGGFIFIRPLLMIVAASQVIASALPLLRWFLDTIG